MKDRIQKEMSDLQDEFNKLREMGKQAEDQQKQIYERMIQIQGAYSKLGQLLEEPKADDSTPAQS